MFVSHKSESIDFLVVSVMTLERANFLENHHAARPFKTPSPSYVRETTTVFVQVLMLARGHQGHSE